MAFARKCFAVAGGASGIGQATVEVLWSEGATIAVSDINLVNLEKLSSKLKSEKPAINGQDLMITAVDVTKSADVDKWIKNIIDKYGRLDGAANVAGMSDNGGLLADKTDADFDFCINLNLRGVFNCMRAQLCHMTIGASIVNVSSGSGLRGMAGISLYSAAKHGVNGLTKSAAKEYGPAGIRINSVCPGLILTPALEAPVAKPFVDSQIHLTPLGRGGQPAEVANVIVFLLGEKSSYQTGSVITVDGGLLC